MTEAVRTTSCPFCGCRVPVVFKVYTEGLTVPAVFGLVEHDCPAVQVEAVEEAA